MAIAKKELLSMALHRSGILTGCRRRMRGLLVVLAYHRIRSDDGVTTEFDDGLFGPTASTFRRQMEWLKRNLRVLSEDEVIATAQSGRPGSPPAVAVTFDDGYADNYALAFPILQELRMPAVFFIPVQSISERRLGWWDLAAYCVKHTKRPEITVEGHPYLLPSGRTAAIRHLTTWMKRRPDCGDQLLAHVADHLDVRLPDRGLQGRELMSWDQVRDLADCGMAIGSHTHTHRILAQLSLSEQRFELEHSKAAIRALVDRPVRLLAYPVGGVSHFTPQTERLAEAAGYALAFSCNTGLNTAGCADPFNVRRISAAGSAALLASTLEFPEVFL